MAFALITVPCPACLGNNKMKIVRPKIYQPSKAVRVCEHCESKMTLLAKKVASKEQVEYQIIDFVESEAGSTRRQ